ncbi:MAG: TadE family type IV pilus minor pilin [Mycobacterium sp.]
MTRGLRRDAGGVTVEAAFAIAALVVVLVLCVAGITTVSMQVRCVDAARVAVRLAARGGDRTASDAAYRIAPHGAALQLRRDGALVVARVTARSVLLPGLTVAADAVAAAEPGVR